ECGVAARAVRLARPAIRRRRGGGDAQSRSRPAHGPNPAARAGRLDSRAARLGDGGSMKRCSQCGEREGVIDLTQVEGTDVRTLHLCAKCAAEKGIQTPGALADTPLGGLLAALGADSTAVATPLSDAMLGI